MQLHGDAMACRFNLNMKEHICRIDAAVKRTRGRMLWGLHPIEFSRIFVYGAGEL
jgi:hypothetical protein